MINEKISLFLKEHKIVVRNGDDDSPPPGPGLFHNVMRQHRERLASEGYTLLTAEEIAERMNIDVVEVREHVKAKIAEHRAKRAAEREAQPWRGFVETDLRLPPRGSLTVQIGGEISKETLGQVIAALTMLAVQHGIRTRAMVPHVSGNRTYTELKIALPDDMTELRAYELRDDAMRVTVQEVSR